MSEHVSFTSVIFARSLEADSDPSNSRYDFVYGPPALLYESRCLHFYISLFVYFLFLRRVPLPWPGHPRKKRTHLDLSGVFFFFFYISGLIMVNN